MTATYPHWNRIPLLTSTTLDFPLFHDNTGTNPQAWLELVSRQRDSFFQKPLDVFHAFDYTRKYSGMYKYLIESKAAEASYKIFGVSLPKGVAIFSFGAPSRNEMMGRSDADVAIYRAGESEKELQFRNRLVESLQEFKFTKIDTPVWGTLNDIRRYMNISVTEANQVTEAQFIYGDLEFREQIEQLKTFLYDREVIARNLVFQFFYFRQYFDRKASPDHLNLKYSPGGTRDFLFPMWYAQLKEGLEQNLQTTALERGLNTLLEEGLLSVDEKTEILKASSAIAFIRDEVMKLTPGDMDGKLSPQKAMKIYGRIPHLFQRPEEIIKIIGEAQPKVATAKAKVWKGLGNYFNDTKSEEWLEYFSKVCSGRMFKALPPELEHDPVINTVMLWSINDQNAESFKDYLHGVSQNDCWTVLASLVSSPYVSGDVIDSVIRRRGLTPGYEYLLEIAARNPNLQRKTLEFIISDHSTESRFKKPALERARKLKLWQR